MSLRCDTVQRIQRKLAAGASIRAVAQEMGVSRATVSEISAGRAARRGGHMHPEPRRCERCGTKILLDDCLICRIQVTQQMADRRGRLRRLIDSGAADAFIDHWITTPEAACDA